MTCPSVLFKQTCKIKPFKGRGAYGNVYDAEVNAKCRIEPKIRKVTDKTGQEVLAGGQIFLAKGSRYEPGSKITYESKEYELISLSPCFSFCESHVEGWFK